MSKRRADKPIVNVCGVPVQPLTKESDWLYGAHPYGCVCVKTGHIAAPDSDPGDHGIRLRRVWMAELELSVGKEKYHRARFVYYDRRARSSPHGAVRGLEATVKWALRSPWLR